MTDLIPWLTAHWAMIMSVLFGISEALANIPGVKANSVFQAIWNVLKALKPQPPVQ